MLEQHVRVVQSSAEGLWVEPAEPAGCELCGGRGCASQQLAQLFQWTARRFRLEPNPDLTVGDELIVSVHEGGILRSALYLYGFPLLLILTGALIGKIVGGEAAAIVGALIGTLGTWALSTSSPAREVMDSCPTVIRYQPLMAISKVKERV